MKKSEIAALLTLAATLERTGWVPDEADVEAWHAMAEHGQWESFDAARQALLVYRSEHPDFPIRPGHITGVLEKVRAEASRRFNAANSNPPDWVVDKLVNDPNSDAYARWIRDSAAEVRHRTFAEFASGERATVRAIEAAS